MTEEKGENARLSAFVGAIAVGDLVKSTLGPKGMDKILQSAYVPRIVLSFSSSTHTSQLYWRDHGNQRRRHDSQGDRSR